ncbi:MAG: hypothetical protein KDN20_15230 [Verrucomicrobiae bacterium]|nr:hypothetical protein [Verrucomicrobiae bacterium]
MVRDSTGLGRVRWFLGFVIFGLVVSGLTAFPLRHELEILAELVTDSDGLSPRFPAFPGLTEWVVKVRDGLIATDETYPFVAYGTDWLAFGHLIIALFFILPFRDPVRYSGVLWIGVVACVLVIPTALICGPIRGIPFFWQLIDCSFGILCLPPLLWALREIRRIESTSAQ